MSASRLYVDHAQINVVADFVIHYLIFCELGMENLVLFIIYVYFCLTSGNSVIFHICHSHFREFTHVTRGEPFRNISYFSLQSIFHW